MSLKKSRAMGVVCAFPLAATSLPVFAQEAGLALSDTYTIIVTGKRLPGSVETDVPPVDEMDERDVDELNASSVGEVLDEISTRTGSGRGRGAAGPVVLLNGRRISNFREIREYPPEAIRKIEVYPEEMALQFGYPPNQRVVNIILKEDIALGDAEIELGAPDRGTFAKGEVNANLTRISKGSRLSLFAQYERTGSITEEDRGVSLVTSPVDQARFRTLQGTSDQALGSVNWAKELKGGTNLSLGVEASRKTSEDLLGLQGGTVTIPAASRFARGAGDEQLYLAFDELGAIRRRSETLAISANAGLTGKLGKWQWTFTNDASFGETSTRTGGDIVLSGLQAAIGSGAANPFAEDLSAFLTLPGDDSSRTRSKSFASTGTINGTPLIVPAGAATVSLKLGYTHSGVESRSVNSGIRSAADLARDTGNMLATLSIPLTSRKDHVLGALGDISLQANAGYSVLSDFDGLYQYGAGLNWTITDRLSASIQYIAEDTAPTLANLGDPLIVTPNVSIYDFRTGETVLASRISGGNADLRGENQRDIKLGLAWRPVNPDGLNLNLEYFRNRSRNVTSQFPLLTDAIEAAFPDRVQRDANNRLILIDVRAINYARTQGESLRFSIGYRGSFGKAVAGQRSQLDELEQQMRRSQAAAAGGAGQGSGGPPGAGGAGSSATGQAQPLGQGGIRRTPGGTGPGRVGPGGPGGGPGGPGGPPPSDGTGRWDIDLTYALQLTDRAFIAGGVTPLDFLHGDASGNSGGTRRHKLDLRGGVARQGLGVRLSASYQSGSDVMSDNTASRLHYADLATLNMRFFLNFDQKPGILEALPFLKGSRMSVRIDNVFDAAQKVTDGNGLVPLRFGKAFQDPVGRFFEIDWRKKF